MPGDNPILDGMKIGAKDGSLLVTDLVGEGFHVLARDGNARRASSAAAAAPTNLRLRRRDAVDHRCRACWPASAEPTYAGQLWKPTFPGGGAPTAKGTIASRGKA